MSGLVLGRHLVLWTRKILALKWLCSSFKVAPQQKLCDLTPDRPTARAQLEAQPNPMAATKEQMPQQPSDMQVGVGLRTKSIRLSILEM